jgi:secondary thiamine-phosphate synthase enzyme
MEKLVIKTKEKQAVIDITEAVEKMLEKTKGGNFCVLFLTHTTAALTTADLDPGGTAEDYLDAFREMVPKLKFRHPHNPNHMPDHVLSSLIGTSLVLPIKDNRLVLGTWQRVVLIEFDGPREREIMLLVGA